MKVVLFLTLNFLSFSLFAMSTNSPQRDFNLSQEVVKDLNIGEELQRLIMSGDVVGNGGGLAEQNFRYTLKNLPKLINDCVSSPNCRIDEKERKILLGIQKIIAQYANDKNTLIFMKQDLQPGFFKEKDDPEIRIARTANLKGSPIFLNLDLIYRSENLFSDFSQMASILIHEFGHQYGIKSHSYLDNLGTKFRIAMENRSETSSVKILGYQFEAKVYSVGSLNSKSPLFFRFDNQYMDLGENFLKLLECEKPKQRIIGYSISNTHWGRLDKQKDKLIAPFHGWVKVNCMDRDGLIWTSEVDLTVETYFSTVDFSGAPLEKPQYLFHLVYAQ